MPTRGMHMPPTFATAITTTKPDSTAWNTLQALYIQHSNTNSNTNTRQMRLGHHVLFPRLRVLFHMQILLILLLPWKLMLLIHSPWISVLRRSLMGFHTNLKTPSTEPEIDGLSGSKADLNWLVTVSCFPPCSKINHVYLCNPDLLVVFRLFLCALSATRAEHVL